MKVLVIDIGGTHVKVASTDNMIPVKIVSGPGFTAKEMVDQVLSVTQEWTYDAVTIGYPGPVRHDRPAAEPHNLGAGWVSFSFDTAFAKPVRFLNDAAMQALGGYKGGTMLFLGIGTGLGSSLVVDHMVVPLELAHLPYRHGRTYEEYIGLAGLERRGKKRWRKSVTDVVARLRAAFVVDYVVLGGGNAKLMKTLPEGVQLGANSNAITGGIALWMGKEVAVVAGESEVSNTSVGAEIVAPPASSIRTPDASAAVKSTKGEEKAQDSEPGKKTTTGKPGTKQAGQKK